MTYKAEQARLFSTADDVNYEVVQIYQMIYSLSHDILGVQGDVAEGAEECASDPGSAAAGHC